MKPLQELFDEMKRNDSWAEGLIMNKHHEGYKAFNQETLSNFLEEFSGNFRMRIVQWSIRETNIGISPIG